MLISVKRVVHRNGFYLKIVVVKFWITRVGCPQPFLCGTAIQKRIFLDISNFGWEP